MKIRKDNVTTNSGQLIIYTGKNGGVELRTDVDNETIWATQDQISLLFEVSRPNITIHLRNIFNSDELIENAVSKDFLLTAKDSKKYKVKLYNLDAILSVGYRVNSKQATQFRIWATKTLRDYLIRGFSIDSGKIQKETERFENLREAVDFIESKTHGRVKGKITLKLTKELI